MGDRDQTCRRNSGKANSKENRDGNGSVEKRRQSGKATACALQRVLHDHGSSERRGRVTVKQVHAFVETNGAPVINKYRPDNAFPSELLPTL
jgi:hypothetical protein